MKLNYRLGEILAAVSAVMGLVGHFVLFMDWYHVGMAAPSAEPGCEILLKYIHPLMADFVIFAAVLFAVSAYGYFSRHDWAFMVSAVGIVLALLGSWFLNVPFMADPNEMHGGSMKLKLFFVSFLVATLIAACGPSATPAEPTPDVAAIRTSAASRPWYRNLPSPPQSLSRSFLRAQRTHPSRMRRLLKDRPRPRRSPR